MAQESTIDRERLYNDTLTEKVVSARHKLQGLRVAHVDRNCIYLDNGLPRRDSLCLRACIFTDVDALDIWGNEVTP